MNWPLPTDWVRTGKSYADDETELFGLYFRGSSAVGIVTVYATAASGLLFEQGASVASAAGTTGNNPGTNGAVNCASNNIADYHALQRKINAVSDWEMWLEAALPDDKCVSGGTTDWLAATDQQCQNAGGYKVKADTDIAQYLSAALTFNAESSVPHPHDGMVMHELLQVQHDIGSTGGTASIAVYECDDVAGTSTDLGVNVPAAATKDTQKYFPSGGNIDEPIAQTKSKRLVVKLSTSTYTVGNGYSLAVIGRSVAFGPGLSKRKTISEY